ncbi:MAG: glycosyltransferase family 2 protein [Bacteroidia bacterium]|nr:glycosyltransferase family 2 protein [Bacteroidia bacterium]NNF31991.1 glycosyltransferase family 2 protein [Flavobacteriaceae bacterium]NNK52946.1 glycosyltransferase family 2 protein [Flavobacteriaceae bacterium]NNM09683.1 glycosyltransferase family 2 protein [Flavobacteriaceae bacterium]
MTVAVVILNWNGRSLLEQFLPSVVRYSSEATVYVADNASTDESVSFVSENYPSVKIIRNKVNGGYAKGYNDALRNLDEDLFVLLNSDVEVTEGWLNPAISLFQKDPDLAAAQPKILDYQNKSKFEYAGAGGGFIDKLGYPYCRGRIFNTIETDHGQYDDTAKIFWATGACLFVRRNSYGEAGGFDEDFFAHQEEIDLCWRLQATGSSVMYIGNSVVYHLGGGTLKASNPRKTFYNFRNTLLMLLKNVKGVKVYGIIFQRLVLDGIAGLMFLLQGKGYHFIAILKAHFSFYSLFPLFLKKRKKHATNLTYSKIKSIVWKYYISKKRNFNEL